MFFKNDMKIILIIIACVYSYVLLFENSLLYYIHPRYSTFTVVLSGLGLLLACISFVITKNKTKQKLSLSIFDFSLLTLLAFAWLIQPTPLTSNTALQRSADDLNLGSASEQIDNLVSRSSRLLNVADWNRILNQKTDPNFYTTRPADVVGFAYQIDDTNKTFMLGRFVVTCCAIDAQPRGVLVSTQGIDEIIVEDGWYQVSGYFRSLDLDSNYSLVLQPDDIKPVEQPTNPYVN